MNTQQTVLVGNVVLPLSVSSKYKKLPHLKSAEVLAGETRLEQTTDGFGGKRCSAIKRQLLI